MTIAGHDLPAGTVVAPCIQLVHRRPEIYPEPARFLPERFLGPEPQGGTYTWIPFGGGVRRCIGAAFAMMELRDRPRPRWPPRWRSRPPGRRWSRRAAGRSRSCPRAVPRCVGRASVGARDGGRPQRALPDRRQLARLPGVLRAARVDRHVRRPADERDLRLRLDAREDPHRPRRRADGRRLGRGHVRPQGDLRRLQGPALLAPRPAQAAVAGAAAARRGLRLPQRRRRGLRGRRRDRRAHRAGARARASR